MRANLRRGSILGATAMLALALTTTPSLAATPVDSPRVTVDSAPSWTRQAPVIASTPAAQAQAMTAVLTMRNQAAAEAQALAVSDPSSAQYGRHLTAPEFRSRFAPTDATVQTVTTWLRAQGFTIGSIPANHRYVSFSGTSAQTEKAFATKLEVFSKNGAHVSAPASSVTIPATLGGTISAIGGLDTSDLRTPRNVGGREVGASTSHTTNLGAPKAQPRDTLPPPSPVFRNGTPCSAYYGQKAASALPQILHDPLTYAPCGYKPGQIRGAYGIDASFAYGIDGRGTTVAIVDAYASPYILGDAQTYAQRNDPGHPLRASQFSQSLPTSYNSVESCDAGGWYGEETLDVEAVHATAPAANILYVGGASCSGPDLNAAVNTIVDNQLAQVITNSYGEVGEPAGSDTSEDHQTFIQAALEGITVTFSSGDNGDEIADTGTRQVDYDASDPFVTAVGGTALAIGATNGYQFEKGWGTGRSVLTNGAWAPNPPAFFYGGGGGTSQLFTEPSYQKKVVPSSIANYFGTGAHRAVPDVAMVADPSTGFLTGQSQLFPDGSIKYSEYRIGGTSLSSPLFAGVTAVADQWNHGSLGFLNPAIYQLAGTAAFKDVTGNGVNDGVVRVDYANGFDSSLGTVTSLRTLNQTGTLKTAVGYDDVTGVGSPDGLGFVAALVPAAKAIINSHPGAGPGAGGGKIHGEPTR